MAAASIAGLLSIMSLAAADAGNRLTYLDEFCDPYYANLATPRLVTPQWIGEEGVEAVIVLANDDHKDPAHHEKYFRPILQRLKQIDGRAGVSLMTTTVNTTDTQLQTWLQEGVTIEAHTTDHPCPCLQRGEFAKARATFESCVDLLTTIPNARPTAFRMPCCDSMNSVTPRFFVEVFNKSTPRGHFLTIDSSVFHVFTSQDPALPRHLAVDRPDRERFRKYVPTDRLMVNLIEDYPYPYVIGRLCWEVPCLMPSDWDAQHLNGKCSPLTVEDLKAAVDAVVVKQGIFSLCFHTHGWIANDQIIQVIDYAAERHGKKVKFMSFREVQDCLDRHLLGGHPIRAAHGQDNGVRLIDLNRDGLLDVVVGNDQVRQTRTWSGEAGKWVIGDFPCRLVRTDGEGNHRDCGARFGVLQSDGNASVLVHGETDSGLWHFTRAGWTEVANGLAGLELDGQPVRTEAGGCDRGVRLRDLDADGVCELIVANPEQNAVFAWSDPERSWRRLPVSLPPGCSIVDGQGRDAGLRFVDVTRDGRADIVHSDAQRYSVHTFASIDEGWRQATLAGKRGERDALDELPMIVRADGSNNGAWFGYGHLWVQNEDTGKKFPDHVDRRSFDRLAGQ